MRHAVDIFDLGPARGSLRSHWLEEAAARGKNFVMLYRDLDVVFLHLGMRLGAEDVGMDIGEVAHVEEVLDGARRGDMHPDGRGVEAAAIRLFIFGNGEELARRA